VPSLPSLPSLPTLPNPTSPAPGQSDGGQNAINDLLDFLLGR
jgi:hypothetical protein